jgi:hypothetical protein
VRTFGEIRAYVQREYAAARRLGLSGHCEAYEHLLDFMAGGDGRKPLDHGTPSPLTPQPPSLEANEAATIPKVAS